MEKKKEQQRAYVCRFPTLGFVSAVSFAFSGLLTGLQASGAVSTIVLTPGENVTAEVGEFFDVPPIVILETNQGSIPIELTPEVAPQTVENFLFYVDSGRYGNSFVHRSASLQDGTPFVIQGGGFFFNFEEDPVRIETVLTQDPVENEFNVSNTRGTVAMAKLGGDPDSATSQWFINLSDNGTILDDQNGGFTVFGRVIADGMTVVDAISEVAVFNAVEQLGGPFGELPLLDNVLDASNFILLDSASRYYPEVTVHFPEGGAEFFEITISEGTISIEAINGAAGTYPLELTASFLDDASQVETVELSIAPDTQWYAGASDAGNGWLYLSWLKFFFPTQESWIYHEHHGWLFPIGENPAEEIVFWDLKQGSFLFTTSEFYPSMYRFSDDKWIFYEIGSSNPRRFFDIETGVLEEVD